MGFASSLSERYILLSNAFNATDSQERDRRRGPRVCRLNPSSPSLIK